MSNKIHESRLEGSGWFESKVSEAEFNGFRREVMEFKQEMMEFKKEIFDKIHRYATLRMSDKETVIDLENRVAYIEQVMEPPELTASPYSSENDEDEDEGEFENASSTSDSGDSESDDEYDQDAYYRERFYDQGDEF